MNASGSTNLADMLDAFFFRLINNGESMSLFCGSEAVEEPRCVKYGQVKLSGWPSRQGISHEA